MSRGGETLVEVVVALLLLTVGALALAAAIGEAQRSRRAAASSALALSGAEAWLEAWRVGPARGRAAGTERIGRGTWEGDLTWSTEDAGPCVESARVAVVAARGTPARAALSSRRFLEPGAGCGP